MSDRILAPAPDSPDLPPEPPEALDKGGRKLWDSVTSTHELDHHEELLLLQACRTTDVLDRLSRAARKSPLTVLNSRGDEIAHPLLTEQRQQSVILSRLFAALQLPSGDEDAENPPRRPRGPRGAYKPRVGHANRRLS